MVRSFSGVRADYGEAAEISAAHRFLAAADAHAFLDMLFARLADRELKVLLGHDPRPTSGALLAAHVRGMLAAAAAAGRRLQVVNLGLIATPAFEESVRELRAAGGLMVTASHCPIHQNGSKYTCGVLDSSGGRHLLAGALLPAGDMAEVMAGAEALVQAFANGDGELIRRLNEVDDAAVTRALTVHPLCREQAWVAFLGFLQRQLALTETEDLDAFRSAVRGAALVLDPNGGTACGTGAVVLRNFGFEVHEVNGVSGRSGHVIEPGEYAYGDLIPAMRAHGARVGGVMDWDADRLNWAARDRGGEIRSAGPQQVAAFNVALWLSWLQERGKLAGQRVAVVAHDPTSGAVEEIAAAFGAQVFRVETGEMNLVERMAELRAEGYLAALGVEGANGGTIFGEDTCRNGFLTLLVAGMVAANGRIPRVWLEVSGRWDSLTEEERGRYTSGDYTLHDVIASLPRYHTRELKAAGARMLTRPGWQGRLKDRFHEAFVADLWEQPTEERRRLCGLGDSRDYVSYRQTNYEKTREVPQRTGDHSGGYKIELTDTLGNRSFLWLRFSRTEASQCRLILDSKFEPEVLALSQRAVELFDKAMRGTAEDEERALGHG
jgi:phosphomannomutase